MAHHQAPRDHQRPVLTLLPPTQIPRASPTPTGDLVEVYKLALGLRSLCAAVGAHGLAAVQVGVPWDLFVVSVLPHSLRVPGEPAGIFLGCDYRAAGDLGRSESLEACPTHRDSSGGHRHFRVLRYPVIQVSGHRLLDSPTLGLAAFDHRLDTTPAVLFQQFIDHGRGVRIPEHGTEVFLW